MNLRKIAVLSSVLCIVAQGMDNKKIYLSTLDGQTTMIPNHLASYFKRYLEPDELGGVEIFSYYKPTLDFVIRLIEFVRERKDLTNMVGAMLFLTENDIAEIQELLGALGSPREIKLAFAWLVAEKRRSAQQVNVPTGPEDTITISAGEHIFSCKKSLVHYIPVIQNMIDLIDGDLTKMHELMLPSNSPLVSADPAVFNTLMEILELYNTTAGGPEGSFDFKPSLVKFIEENDLSAQFLARLIELVNYLDVKVLYQPLIDAIASLIGQEKIKSTELSLAAFGDETNHYIKDNLIKPLMYEFQLIAMRKAKPKVVINNVPGVYVSYSPHGVCACTYGAHKISLVNLEHKQLLYNLDLPFNPYNCTLSDDGTVAVLNGKEGNSEGVYLLNLDTKKITSIMSFPSPITIKSCVLSPDKTKICVITSQNRLLILSGEKFSQAVADFNFAPAGQHDCNYTVHWFPSSLKCVVNISDYTLQKNNVYIVGATAGTHNMHYRVYRVASGAIDAVIATSLHDNKALIIPNKRAQTIITFASETQIIPFKSVELQYTQVEGDLHDAVVSSTGKYILIFSEDYLDIMEAATGVFVSDFDDIFPAHFNKDDTGLWAYNPSKDCFEFYQYRTGPIVLLEQILLKLSLQQLQVISRICKAMKDKVRTFTGFSENEKKVLLAEGHMRKEMEYVRRFLYMLQALYNKMYGNFVEEQSAEEAPSAEPSTDTDESGDAGDDDMDIDQEESQEEQPQQQAPQLAPEDRFPELEKFYKKPGQ